jgi:pimeloyl-ACP methyl ester carboxylesterase
MRVLRTPDSRFTSLPDFPYEARYVDDLDGYAGMRAAYIDEPVTQASAATFLCLHGQPSWSFLYRKMIPVFLGSGARVVAPDFFGFGRSDKPADEADYSFAFHREFLLRLVERLDLRDITLVVQDWGGLLGLTLPVDPAFRDRLSRLIVMNTTIAVGAAPSDGFVAWRAYCKATPDLPIGRIIKRGTPFLSEAEVAAYDAPFPDSAYKAGARAFPQLVMTDPSMAGVEESRQALRFWSQQWDGPTFMAVGAADPVLGPGPMETLRSQIRGCPPPLVVPDGGHFLQEWGVPVAQAALAHFATR